MTYSVAFTLGQQQITRAFSDIVTALSYCLDVLPGIDAASIWSDIVNTGGTCVEHRGVFVTVTRNAN